jgi:hypothetical protein
VKLRLPDGVGGKIVPAPQTKTSQPPRIHRPKTPVADALSGGVLDAPNAVGYGDERRYKRISMFERGTLFRHA